MPVLATWDKNVLPLGCRGHYGSSGTNWHYRNGTPTCDLCKASTAHQRWVKRTEAKEAGLSRSEKELRKQIAVIATIKRDGKTPLFGCNGKFGASGYYKHRRANELPCADCCAASAQWNRYKNLAPKVPHVECGTIQAAWRHRKRRETLDLLCLAVETTYNRENKRRQRGSK